MPTFIEIVLIPIAATVTLFLYSVTVLPLLYGFPRSVYWALCKRAKWNLPIRYLAIGMVWGLIWFGLLFILVNYVPSVWSFINNSWGCWVGSWIGLLVFVIRIISKTGRKDLKDDFIELAKKYQ